MTTPKFVSPRDALDIVFANRNKAYGAYQLRREYPANLGRALGASLLLILLFIALPHLLKAISGNTSGDDPNLDREYVMGAPPDIAETPPPPPPVETPPPPVRTQDRFVPPIVKIDNDVQENELPKAIEDLVDNNKDIGKVSQEGEVDLPPSDLPTNIGPPAIVEPQISAPEKEYDLVTVQKMPSFPGGEGEMLKYLAKSIEYPAQAIENSISGTVVLSFVITKEGKIGDVSILKEIGGGCGKEAVRVVKSMPQWIPGEASGHPVKVRFTLPVKFRLDH